MSWYIFPLVITVLASYQDIKIREISPILTTPLIATGLIVSILFNPMNLIAVLIITTILMFANAKGMIGGGDVKLIAGLILWNQFPNIFLYCLFLGLFSTLSALAYSFPRIIASRKFALNQTMAMAPFILAGWIITITGLALW